MTLLYKGGYKRRFEQITPLIKGKSVTELCFGDTYIAEYCLTKNINWKGIDVNPAFVERAKDKGFNAVLANINLLEELPTADTLIICGSLYHFYDDVESLLDKMATAANYIIIISEPVINISEQKNIFGRLAVWLSRMKKKTFEKRFNTNSLTTVLDIWCNKNSMKHTVTGHNSKDIVIVIQR